MNETLGQRINNLMLENGWTMRELAEKAETTDSTIFRIIHGREPKAWLLYRLSKAFGVTMESLLEEVVYEKH